MFQIYLYAVTFIAGGLIASLGWVIWLSLNMRPTHGEPVVADDLPVMTKLYFTADGDDIMKIHADGETYQYKLESWNNNREN